MIEINYSPRELDGFTTLEWERRIDNKPTLFSAHCDAEGELIHSRLVCYCCGGDINHRVLTVNWLDPYDAIKVFNAYLYLDNFWCMKCLRCFKSKVQLCLKNGRIPTPIVEIILKHIFSEKLLSYIQSKKRKRVLSFHSKQKKTLKKTK